MAIHRELGDKNKVNLVFNHGFEVLSRVTQTRDEDIRTAEEMLAMGADLQEAKRVCKEDGKLFEVGGMSGWV